MTLKLATLRSKIKFSYIWLYIEYKTVTLINCRVLHSRFSYFLLILSKNKENVTFTCAAGVQHVLFLTITGDKFVIYVPIRRYGDFNTLQ
jgi:hypothetical protein